MLKIVTFNIRSCWLWENGDNINSFVFRSGLIFDAIDTRKPDIIFFQEVTEKLADFLEKHLYHYDFLYHGRCENMHGEGLAVAWNRDTVDYLSQNVFWLSPTPYLPNSRFENQSECPRICAAYMMRERETDTVFRVYNTHLDHISSEARVQGASLMLERIKDDNDNYPLPFIVLGDFNGEPDSEEIKLFNNFEAVSLNDITGKFEYTFHDWGRRKLKIDYIFVDDLTLGRVKDVHLWDDYSCGIYLSDHYPIEADIDI